MIFWVVLKLKTLIFLYDIVAGIAYISSPTRDSENESLFQQNGEIEQIGKTKCGDQTWASRKQLKESNNPLS